MTPNKPSYSNQEILDLLKQNNKQAIEYLFKSEYKSLCFTAYRVVKEQHTAEDLVQDVFFELWRRRETINIRTSIRAYLKRAVINKTLNYVRDKKIKYDDEGALQFTSTKQNIQLELEASEMQKLIDLALDDLPPKCQMVFLLSRYDQLSYQEIADKLDISTKTVENHISKALKRLRIALGPYIKTVSWLVGICFLL